MRKLLLNTVCSVLFLTAPLFASDETGGDSAHMSSPSGNQAEHKINFHEIVMNLPTDVGKLVSSHMDKESFESLRLTSKAYADLGFDQNTLLARKAIFVIKDRKDLPAFAQMMKERNLYNIPIEITDIEITDEDLVYLEKATSVKLLGCLNITDEGLKSLTHATNLNLAGCLNITDEGLKSLTHATNLNLGGCRNITDEGLKSLTHVKEVSLYGCRKISNKGLQYLKEATSVNLGACYQITGQGLQYLKEATSVSLKRCEQITDEDLVYLKKATSVDLSECPKITDQGVAHLEKVKVLNIVYCDKVSEEAKETLRARGVQVFG